MSGDHPYDELRISHLLPLVRRPRSTARRKGDLDRKSICLHLLRNEGITGVSPPKGASLRHSPFSMGRNCSTTWRGIASALERIKGVAYSGT